MKKLIVVVLGLLSGMPCALAMPSKWDANLYLEGAYPLGGGLNAYLGYNWLVWGQKKPNNLVIGEKSTPEWQYGYIRPHVRLFSNIYTNRGEVRFDFYPISIFGMTFGGVAASRSKNNDDFNCAIVSCKGMLYRTFVENNLKLGYSDYFATWTTRIDFLFASQDRVNFVDESSKLAGAGKEDQLFRSTASVGANLNDDWRLAVFHNIETMLKTRNTGSGFGIVGRYKWSDEWQFQLTLSSTDVPTSKRGYSGTFRVTWVPEPSYAL